MKSLTCPGRQVLSDYCEDKLSPEARAEVDRHLTQCSACRSAVETVDGHSATIQQPPRARNSTIVEKPIATPAGTMPTRYS